MDHDRRIGPYQLLSLIGTGGMGEVYRARDTKLERDVAVKLLPRAFASDPDRLARFQREARVLASLNHPHIATIFGLEDADGLPAIVMELVEGETVADRLARNPARGAERRSAGRSGSSVSGPGRWPGSSSRAVSQRASLACGSRGRAPADRYWRGRDVARPPAVPLIPAS